ncbi:MAG TPA: DNA gyrase inhibitor YacG [Allosphingosinicella sp.]|jgi:hypothetical protein
MSEALSPAKARRHACPLCGRPASADHAPFCGQGCRDRDLLNWLGDAYRVPGLPADEGLDSEGEAPL